MRIMTPEELEKEFNRLKEAKDFEQIGHLCFRIFVTRTKDDPVRQKTSELWKSLSETEQSYCE